MSNTQPPSMGAPVVRSRWTAKDEENLQELTERKARIDAQNREPLEQMLAADGRYTPGDTQYCNWLIANATQLRALLVPFDHSAES